MTESDEYVTVAQVGDIPDQEGRAFPVNDVMVAVFNDRGVYRAIDDMCPHAGASLATGFFADGCVSCPWHAWKFDTTDGAFCENPRLKIDVYDVRIEGESIMVSATPRPTEPESDAGSGTMPTTSEQDEE